MGKVLFMSRGEIDILSADVGCSFSFPFSFPSRFPTPFSLDRGGMSSNNPAAIFSNSTTFSLLITSFPFNLVYDCLCRICGLGECNSGSEVPSPPPCAVTIPPAPAPVLVAPKPSEEGSGYPKRCPTGDTLLPLPIATELCRRCLEILAAIVPLPSSLSPCTFCVAGDTFAYVCDEG